MSVVPPATVTLEGRFARELAELAVPWQAEEALDPRLLVLNESTGRRTQPRPGLAPQRRRPVAAGRQPRAQRGDTRGTGLTPGTSSAATPPRLGDGRALLLGEVADADGHLRDLHLKGSGRTPFARGGDGLAAVGPMLREYVVSEAMHALGIPTTRSLAVGRRAAWCAARHRCRAPCSPGLPAATCAWAASSSPGPLAISGVTIDYGPCALWRAFDPAMVYSSIDTVGHYAHGNQPVMAEWNLARLAEALLPLIHDDQEQAVTLAVDSLAGFRQQYSAAWFAGVQAKLGLPGDPDDVVTSPLVNDLLSLLLKSHVDYTSCFRGLGAAACGDAEPARSLILDLAAIDAWLERWRALGPDADLMDAINPAYIPRNHLVEQALTAATEREVEPIERLLDAVTAPYEGRPGLERYAAPAPDDFRAYRTFCGT